MSNSRCRDERGVVLVEAAIVTTIAFAFIFLIFQSAFYARGFLSARDAAASGARAGSIGADDAVADYNILHAIDKSVTASSRENIMSIVVFKPQGPQFSMPEGCASGGQTGLCNYYESSDLSRPVSDFAADSQNSDHMFWDSTSRKTSTETGTDYLGVQVTVRVGGIAGPYADTVTKTAVVLLEPHG